MTAAPLREALADLPPGLPRDADRATLVGRILRPGTGPAICTVRDGDLVDITSRAAPTVHHLLELDDPAAHVREAEGVTLGSADQIALQSFPGAGDGDGPTLLAPIDLQAIKASGVTFVTSLLERVIEEQARGEPERAAAIRTELQELIGDDLSRLKPGSPEALTVKDALIARNAWSQYLEVGIGPYAEIFTKCQPLSSVGHGADIGMHPESSWNNPEPEIVLVVDSRGRTVGAALGNDVNLRDFEGRSALLLGKAKDNNASCAIGPFVRLFDDGFTIDHVRDLDLALTVTGDDGFVLEGASSMREISRDPLDLVAATFGANHQYPDGFCLFLGTMFAPVKDRDRPGEGFTHKLGDRVTIETPLLGALTNHVSHCADCPPWTFGTAALMANLAGRGLL